MGAVRGQNKIVKVLGHHVIALEILLGHRINVSSHKKLLIITKRVYVTTYKSCIILPAISTY